MRAPIRVPGLLALSPLMLAASCEHTPEELCAGAGPESMELGKTSGADFEPFVDGEALFIAEAPQGGFGVQVRARTWGLVAGTSVDLVLSSYHEGESTGTFDWGPINLYCQEDGSGLMWGAVVPFDPDRFPTREDLAVLDGERVTLELVATDVEGEQATGTADITLHLVER